MPDAKDKSALREKLEALAQDTGLRRRELAGELGGGLCQLWGIKPGDDDDATFDKVADKFQQVIQKLKRTRDYSAQEIQMVALVNYNLTNNPEIWAKDLHGRESRRKWLQDGPTVKNRQGRAIELAVPVETQRNVMRDHVFKLLEESFLTDWARSFPGKPFSVNQPLPSDQRLPDLPPLKRSHFWRRPVALVCITTVVLAAGAVGLVLLTPGTARADCADAASALDIKQPYTIRDAYGGWSVAYPGDRSDSARESLGRLDRTKTHPKDYDLFLSQELDAGAYLLSGMKLTLEFTALDEREVIIRDIRPVIHQRPEIPVEAVIFAPTQGGDVTQAYFVLDDVRPAARIKNTEKATSGDLLLFDVKRFRVPTGPNDESFTLHFEARYSAFIFDVIVDYEVDGVSCARIINRNGRPFQVTAKACPALFVADKNRDRDLQPLKALRYTAIRNTAVDKTTNKYIFTPSDPEIFASRCGDT